MRRLSPRLVAPAVVALACLAVLVVVLVTGHRAKADFASFKQCPLRDPQTDLCLYTRAEGGEFVAGSKTIPISRAITLQGGVHVVENREKEVVKDEFIAARGGATMTRTPQPVPGGLRAIVDPGLLSPALRKVFEEHLASGLAQVTATIELAGPASSIGVSTQNLIEARGIGLSLPLKVKLSNSFLGESCYIGSNAHPIVMSLTTGRTDTTSPSSPSHESIAGKPGHAKFEDDYNLVTLREDSLVSDSFAAPRVEGCGGILSSRVDSAIDAELGLPAATGRNTAILNVTLHEANAPAARASG